MGVRPAVLVAVLAVVAAGCDGVGWGDNSRGQLGIGAAGGVQVQMIQESSGRDWHVLEAGANHTCGITNVATLWCWGSNNDGQIGDGTEDVDRVVPTQVGSATDWKSVSLGGNHSCAIRDGGKLYCWGRGSNGQLGLGTETKKLTPQRVGTETDWVSVDAGTRHTCGIRAGGLLYCWGSNLRGEVGNGTLVKQTSPVGVGGTWREVSAGSFTTCAIASATSTLWCWGDNNYDQIDFGTGKVIGNSYPTPQNLGVTADAVSVGGTHVCFIRPIVGPNPEALLCDGNNDNGQLGALADPRTGIASVHVGHEPDTFVEDWHHVSAGNRHTCAIMAPVEITPGVQAELFCWGRGDSGQLGNGGTLDQLEPVTVSPKDNKWISVSAGQDHTVALRYDP